LKIFQSAAAQLKHLRALLIVLRMPVSRRAYLRSALAGVVTFFAVYVTDTMLARAGLHAEVTYANEALLGTVVAVLIIVLEAQHERELRAEQQRYAIALEMNHHIRNALQTIVYVNWANPDQNAAERIRQASVRIEWALREVLPRIADENQKLLTTKQPRVWLGGS
jgi:hypothetical protein